VSGIVRAMPTPVWLDHYEPGVPAAVPPPDALFHAALAAAAGGSPGYPALVCVNRQLSYAELDALTGRAAAAMVRDGVRPGDRVLLALPSCAPFVVAALGALKAGAVVAPVDVDRDALAPAVRRLAPRLAVVSEAVAAPVAEALDGRDVRVVVVRSTDALTPLLRLLYRLGAPRRARTPAGPADGTVRWPRWLPSAALPAPVPVTSDHPALVVTGRHGHGPLATFSHAHLVAGALQLRAWLTDALPGDDTWFVLEPLATPWGLVAGLGAPALLRSRLVLVPHPTGRDIVDVLRYRRPAYVATGAAAVRRLVADATLARSDLRSVRAWLVGEPLEPSVARLFEEASGVAICQGYAAPRIAGLGLCNPVNSRRAAGSVGLPMPGVGARVVDEHGQAVSPGTHGRLAVCGPNIGADGWLTTPVGARMDEAGFVYLLDHGRAAADAPDDAAGPPEPSGA
jgi:long-chain acyl-CoA synthetase